MSGYNYDDQLNWTRKQRYFYNTLSQLKSTKMAISDNTRPNVMNRLMYTDHLNRRFHKYISLVNVLYSINNQNNTFVVTAFIVHFTLCYFRRELIIVVVWCVVVFKKSGHYIKILIIVIMVQLDGDNKLWPFLSSCASSLFTIICHNGLFAWLICVM